MSTVKPAANRAMYSAPKAAIKAAPATAEPAVLATVFRVRMAAMGFSTLLRRRKSTSPTGLPSLRIFSMADQGTAYRAASVREQVKEMATATLTARIRVSIGPS